MDLGFLHDGVTHTGPPAVAHVHETRSDETGLHEQGLHGRDALLVRSVAAQGGEVELVDGVQGVLRQGVGPSGRSGR